jgi:hypothetical protein
MTYGELIQLYFERSVALQWYWTVYVLVIGGIVGFSTVRQRPEIVTTVLVTALYFCFAYKNLGAIAETAEERQAVLAAARTAPANPNAADVQRVREHLEPKLSDYDVAGAKYFHIFCDALTVVFLWAKEWTRKNREGESAT